MSALPIDHYEEPRLARLLANVKGWPTMHTDVVKVLGRRAEQVLVQQINSPYRTALVKEEAISFSCECGSATAATHLVRTGVGGTHVEYLLCNSCYADEQYVEGKIEWGQVDSLKIEEEPMSIQPTVEEVRAKHKLTGPALLEQADLVWSAMQQNSWSTTEAGAHFGITQGKASELARLARAPEEVREAVRSGEKPLYRALAEIPRLPRGRRPQATQPQPEPAPAQEEKQKRLSGGTWGFSARHWRGELGDSYILYLGSDEVKVYKAIDYRERLLAWLMS